jgi:hypothetical protein
MKRQIISCSYYIPFSFSKTWINLRNVDDLYAPAHKFESVKRFPLFIFPRAWNNEPARKNNEI